MVRAHCFIAEQERIVNLSPQGHKCFVYVPVVHPNGFNSTCPCRFGISTMNYECPLLSFHKQNVIFLFFFDHNNSLLILFQS